MELAIPFLVGVIGVMVLLAHLSGVLGRRNAIGGGDRLPTSPWRSGHAAGPGARHRRHPRS
jgi:hypothetical protein